MMSFNCIARAAASVLGRFRRDDSGVALVEFTVVLPMMLLTFALIVEGSRTMLAYNSTINGVRDATRYLARVVGRDACTTNPSLTGYTTLLTSMVQRGGGSASIFPGAVTVTSVTPTFRCVSGTWRGGNNVAVAEVYGS
jgi:Flp pilus assembly pilin Flp